MQWLCVFLLVLMHGIAVVNGTQTHTFCGNETVLFIDAIITHLDEIPDDFTDGFICSETITPAPGHILMVRNLRYEVPCAYGTMEIYDPSDSSDPTKTICGPLSNPAIYTSFTHSVKFVFTWMSRSRMLGRGFRLLITRVSGYNSDIPAVWSYPSEWPTGLINRAPFHNEFRCDNGYIISSSLKCDSYNNCGDNSDETEDICRRITHSTRPAHFQCGNGHIIALSLMCNGHDNCGDGSDEPEDTCHGTTNGHTFAKDSDVFEDSNDHKYSTDIHVGAIASGVVGIVVVIIIVIALRIRHIRIKRAVNLGSQRVTNVDTITTVRNATPAGQASPHSPTPAPYPPSQYDHGYGY